MKKIWVLIKTDINAYGGHDTQFEIYASKEAAIKNLETYRLKFYRMVESDRSRAFWSASDTDTEFQCTVYDHRYKYRVVEDVLREE